MNGPSCSQRWRPRRSTMEPGSRCSNFPWQFSIQAFYHTPIYREFEIGTVRMELSEDDVLEILKLFEQSKFDFLQLEHGERKITVSKGGYGASAVSAAAHAAPQTPAV